MMQSYYGHVRTQQDAILLFEACRQGLIPRIRRRLSERERFQITSGCVYIWDEQEAGMRRWTDGKSWSASRVSGAFLTYREMDGSRRPSSPDGKQSDSADGSPQGSSPQMKKRTKFWDNDVSVSSSTPASSSASDSGSGNGSEEGYRYKPNGLYKQSFSITTSSNLKLHLISYYRKEDIISGKLVQPTSDPRIKDLPIPLNLYPDTSPGVSLIPAITNAPLVGRHQMPTADGIKDPMGILVKNESFPQNGNNHNGLQKTGGFGELTGSPTPQYSNFASSTSTMPPSPSGVPPNTMVVHNGPEAQYYQQATPPAGPYILHPQQQPLTYHNPSQPPHVQVLSPPDQQPQPQPQPQSQQQGPQLPLPPPPPQQQPQQSQQQQLPQIQIHQQQQQMSQRLPGPPQPPAGHPPPSTSPRPMLPLGSPFNGTQPVLNTSSLTRSDMPHGLGPAAQFAEDRRVINILDKALII
ncbi:Mit1p [Sugiyamaella lignohabitans]|uniref:Mit1p n=1 Tax=Sugiyamaella lignohabitans TaxID=796027 RepID=A0A167CN54_9ASCO|nr:Mit1p [Sugiyamaella lignohabitans]ANB11910.1 Mit1p [Sugiyamaella lignohabitans]